MVQCWDGMGWDGMGWPSVGIEQTKKNPDAT